MTERSEAAMNLFWRKGYEATSMQDLVDHLGIGRASIYATFGSKHALYIKTLQHYRERSDVTVRRLSEPGPALSAVRAFVNGLVEDKLADAERKGCFAANTAGECLPGDGQSARQVEAVWSTLETVLISTLHRAQAQGELPADKNPRELGRFLLTVIEGIEVLATAPTPSGSEMRRESP